MLKKSKKIVTRLVLRYSSLFLIALIVIFILITGTYYQSILREKSNVLQQKLDFSADALNSSIDRITTLHQSLSGNTYLKRELVGYQSGVELDALTVTTMDALLADYRSDGIEANAIYLYAPDGTLLSSASNSLQKAPDELLALIDEFVASRAYRKIVQLSTGELVYFGAALSNSFQYVGTYAIVINYNRLFYSFQLKARQDFDAAYVYDGERLIYRVGTEVALSGLPGNAAAMLRGDGTRFLQFRERSSAYSEWRLLAVSDLRLIMQEVTGLIIAMVLAMILATGCIVLVSFGIAKRITAPLSAVTASMRILEHGTFPQPLPSDTQDETNDLVCGYNHMVENLQKLTEDIAFEQRERRKYETASIKMKLDLLQSQINPHFIHNTLNTLNYMALEAGNAELSSTIVSFNSLLRASINTETEYTTVAEEVQYVSDYMNIQQKRYADREVRLSFSIVGAEDALLPRLILQPLVENSLFHGILPMTDGIGRVHILCSAKDGILHVYIVDNGVGIPEEKLDQLNAGQLPPSNSYNHIGFQNVRERLELLYGDSAQFAIISQEYAGTTIYFSIPAVM